MKTKLSMFAWSLVSILLLMASACGGDNTPGDANSVSELAVSSAEGVDRAEGLNKAVKAAEKEISAAQAAAGDSGSDATEEALDGRAKVMAVQKNDGGSDIEKIRKLYQQSCISCHAYGAAGAPKTHDEEAWRTRLVKGKEALMESLLQGIGGMPPKGLCASCTEEDLWALTEFMAQEKP